MQPVTRVEQSLSGQAVAARSDTAQARKIVRAARDFESVLLGSVFGALEHTFSELGGKPSDPGSENYQAMAMQALGKRLAASGGVGIANMIVRNLFHSGGSVTQGTGTDPTKVTSVKSR
jgi:Rod binding domain-containing protein